MLRDGRRLPTRGDKILQALANRREDPEENSISFTIEPFEKDDTNLQTPEEKENFPNPSEIALLLDRTDKNGKQK